MDFLDDPAELTPEQRLAEVAAILATGWLRTFERPAALASDIAGSAPFTEKPLDCSAAPMAVCVNGLTAKDPKEHAA